MHLTLCIQVQRTEVIIAIEVKNSKVFVGYRRAYLSPYVRGRLIGGWSVSALYRIWQTCSTIALMEETQSGQSPQTSQSFDPRASMPAEPQNLEQQATRSETDRDAMMRAGSVGSGQVLEPAASHEHPEDAMSGVDRDALAPLVWSSGERGGAKGSTWYGAYVLGAIILSGLIFLLTRDAVSTGAVLIGIIGLMLFAGRTGGEQNYELREGMLVLGQRAYALREFKAFSVNHEQAPASIVLTPLKRFMPAITVYAQAETLETVAAYLSHYLPSVPHKTDGIDSLLRSIRF